MTSIAKNLDQWLRDAHAAERQAESMMSTAADRIDNYPDLAQRIRQHVDETRRQRERLEQCLDRRDAGASAMKDAAGQLSAMMQGMTNALAGDEVVKTVLFSYAFEHMEIASYRILVTAAEAAGDTATRDVCQEILREEVAMADWLEQAAPEITRTFLQRDQSAAIDAKR